MGTTCYAMVRGSAIRITRLDSRGRVVGGPRSSLVSRNVTKVAVNAVTENRPGLSERNWGSEDLALYVPPTPEVVHYTTDIDFLLTDPDAIEILTGQPVIRDPGGDVVGFTAEARRQPQAFALEIWTKLSHPVNGYGYGYTVLPFLRGGTLSGFTVADGDSVSFSLKGAVTRRSTQWGSGPYVLYDPSTAGWDLVGWDTLPWDSAPWGTPVAACVGGGDAAAAERLPVATTSDTFFMNFLTPGVPESSCGARELLQP